MDLPGFLARWHAERGTQWTRAIDVIPAAHDCGLTEYLRDTKAAKQDINRVLWREKGEVIEGWHLDWNRTEDGTCWYRVFPAPAAAEG